MKCDGTKQIRHCVHNHFLQELSSRTSERNGTSMPTASLPHHCQATQLNSVSWPSWSKHLARRWVCLLTLKSRESDHRRDRWTGMITYVDGKAKLDAVSVQLVPVGWCTAPLYCVSWKYKHHIKCTFWYTKVHINRKSTESAPEYRCSPPTR